MTLTHKLGIAGFGKMAGRHRKLIEIINFIELGDQKQRGQKYSWK
jgi:hypothetical protein